MSKISFTFLILIFFSCSGVFAQATRTVAINSSGDALTKSNGDAPLTDHKAYRVGGSTGSYDGASVHPFQLPALSSSEKILSATVSIYLNAVSNNPQGHVDLYALPYRDAKTVFTSDFFQGDYGTAPNSTPLQDDFATRSTPSGYINSNSTGSDNLVAYLNAQYDAGATEIDYIFIRLNPDAADVTAYHYWDISTTKSTGKEPILDIEIVSIPVTNVNIDQAGPIIIAPGTTINLSATVSPSNAINKNISWSSSNNSIASVGSDGLVTAGSTESPVTITVTTEDGSFTDDIEIIVDCSAIPAPANFDAMKGYTEVSLSWDAVEGAEGYKIYYGTSSGGPYTIEPINDGTINSTVISGFTNNIPYYFKITTEQGVCESDPSPEATATPSDIFEYTGPNVYISTLESGKNLGQGMIVERIDGQPANKKGLRNSIPLDFVVDISAPNAGEDINACLTFYFNTASFPEGMNLASIVLYRFDEQNQFWVKMGGKVNLDGENSYVKLCGINEFSNWTLAGSMPPESVPLQNWGLVLIFLVAAGIIAIRKF